MNKRYSTDGLWIEIQEELAVIGLAPETAAQLQDIQYLEFRNSTKTLHRGDILCTIESAKMTFDVYSPLDGTITTTNPDLVSEPNLIIKSPENLGWLCRISPTSMEQLNELLTVEQYREYFN